MPISIARGERPIHHFVHSIAFLLEDSRSFANKNCIMDLSTVANVATALTVITGVGFGLVEAQRSRRAREERAAYAAVQALLSQAWMKSMIVVHSIPDGSSASAIEANAEVLNAAHSVGVILEGLGYSV